MTTTVAGPTRALLAVTAAGALVLSGCGSGATRTVSVPSATTSGMVTQPATTTGATHSSPPTTTPTSATTTPTSPASAEATRTTTAPAFTTQPTGAEGLSAAVAVVKAHGYTPANTSEYHPQQTLRVLVGTREGSADGYGQQVFFFVENRYIGTDAKEPSATVKVIAQSDTEVTLSYPLYKPHDSLCCPSGGQATVRFQLDNGQLVALNPIPPANSQTGLSRQ